MGNFALFASVAIVVTAAAIAAAVFRRRANLRETSMPALIPIHQIAAADRDGYRPRWETIVSSWESNSPGAVREADDLAQEIMKRQGFPMSNLARRLREVPVEYADVTYMFRRAHALRMATDDGRFSDATTRSAMYYYSALFAFLLRDRQKIDH